MSILHMAIFVYMATQHFHDCENLKKYHDRTRRRDLENRLRIFFEILKIQKIPHPKQKIRSNYRKQTLEYLTDNDRYFSSALKKTSKHLKNRMNEIYTFDYWRTSNKIFTKNIERIVDLNRI